MSYTAILIDDEAWTRETLRDLGNWAELDIVIIAEASDGENGRELIARLRPDIIITDVKMPHMTGIELLQALRRDGNCAKVLFVSGYDDFEFVRDAMRLQAKDYLLKPVKPDELNSRLARCVEELAREKTAAGPLKLNLQGFMNINRLNEYAVLKDGIYEALYAHDGAVLSRQFEKLSAFLRRQPVSAMTPSLVLCIFYDLHNCLLRYIKESGHTLLQVFGAMPPSLVFGQSLSLDDLLSHMEMLCNKAHSGVQYYAKSQSRIDIKKIQGYMDANFLNGISLESTAARFYISKEYLSKMFKQETGCSFSDYLTGLKMNKAKELLTEQSVPIKDIAQMTGYADQAHFYKAFKKYYGTTPGDILRKIKY